MLTAIYCRLSKEDADKQLVSESIQNQKSLLIQYAVEKGWDIYKIYCDEDYSGIDRARPAFMQLIKDAERKRFNAVLVKTQSRFTRDMELVEKYIHGLFVEWGIRFVATVDHIDTDVKGNKKARQISGLINEWYLEDLSENIRTVFDYKRHAGQYIGAFPLYGYQKDPANKNKLVLEAEAAAVVKHIFSLYLAGRGTQSIAAVLNAENVQNPTKHKQALGCNYKNGSAVNDYGLWNRTTVSRILRNPMYVGDLVQGRTKRMSYKSKKMICVPEEKWVVVPNAQEAIIDRESFQIACEMLTARTKSSGLGEVHTLAGKVYCMDCGSIMHKYSNTSADKRNSYLRCKLYANNRQLCTNHNIRLDWLEEIVLERLQGHLASFYSPDGAEDILQRNAPQECDAQNKERERLEHEIAQRGKAMQELYLDKSRGVIDEAQFLELNQSYLAQKRQMEKRMQALPTESEHRETSESRKAKLRAQIEALQQVTTLSRALVSQFIDTIEVGRCGGGEATNTGAQKIIIHWLI